MEKKRKYLTEKEILTICENHAETCKNCPLNVSHYYNFFMCSRGIEVSEYEHKDEILNEIIVF